MSFVRLRQAASPDSATCRGAAWRPVIASSVHDHERATRARIQRLVPVSTEFVAVNQRSLDGLACRLPDRRNPMDVPSLIIPSALSLATLRFRRSQWLTRIGIGKLSSERCAWRCVGHGCAPEAGKGRLTGGASAGAILGSRCRREQRPGSSACAAGGVMHRCCRSACESVVSVSAAIASTLGVHWSRGGPNRPATASAESSRSRGASSTSARIPDAVQCLTQGIR